MVKPVVKNEHKKGTCHDKIGLCAQNVDIVIGSTINMNKRTGD